MNDHFETDLRPTLDAEEQGSQHVLARLFPLDPAEYALDVLPFRIGRDAGFELALDHPSISRLHATIEDSDRGLVLSDQKSKNGSFVNGRAVEQSPVKAGDVLRFGGVLFQLLERPLGQPTSDASKTGALVGGRALDPIRRQIEVLGPTSLRMMITGESGTGKEVVARELHRASLRSGPFVAINCAALPDSLVEAELFGYMRGAFTGANSDKPGLFEVARGGTLFLDEVTELPLTSQAKLLRVVESGELRRIGAVKDQRVDCRILSATNHDLARDVEQGRFRADLAARLGEAEIRLLPLREHMEDLPRLIGHLGGRAGCRLRLSAEVVELLALHAWPLNVRELDNTVRYLDAIAAGKETTCEMLPQLLSIRPKPSGLADSAADAPSDKMQRVIDELRDNGGNIRATSQRLGVSRTYIYRCLDRSGLKPGELRNDKP